MRDYGVRIDPIARLEHSRTQRAVIRQSSCQPLPRAIGAGSLAVARAIGDGLPNHCSLMLGICEQTL